MKYFDKDFFKFTFGFLAIISLSLLIIIATSLYIEEGNDAQVANPDIEGS